MPRIVDHDQRRDELTKHVWALIRRQGLDGVTIRNLCQQSGWSSGAIRHYLPTRESILTFAAERLGSAVEAHLQSLRLSGEPLEQFEQFLLALLPLDDPSQEWLEIWLAFTVAAVRGENYADSHGILYRDLHTALQDILQDFARMGWLSGQTPERAANGLHALIDGLALHLLLHQLSPDEARAIVQNTVKSLIVAPPHMDIRPTIP